MASREIYFNDRFFFPIYEKIEKEELKKINQIYILDMVTSIEKQRDIKKYFETFDFSTKEIKLKGSLKYYLKLSPWLNTNKLYLSTENLSLNYLRQFLSFGIRVDLLELD